MWVSKSEKRRKGNKKNKMAEKQNENTERELVSVVVPIYKVEQWLERCIQSIIRQTYNELEIILVDDGSPDNCPKLCDEWAKNDNRIKVIHKKNGGLSDARNAGLRNACGKYIYFLDSDDYIEPQLVERCIQVMKETNCEIVSFGYVNEDENGNVLGKFVPSINNCETKNQEKRLWFVEKMQIAYSYTAWNAWARFFCMEFLKKNNLEFPDNNVVFAEDLAFALRASVYQTKIVNIKECLYHYICRKDSIMGKIDYIPFEKMVNLGDEFKEFLKNRGFEDNVLKRINGIAAKILYNELRKYESAELRQSILLRKNLKNETKRKTVRNWCWSVVAHPKHSISYHGKRFYLWATLQIIMLLGK